MRAWWRILSAALIPFAVALTTSVPIPRIRGVLVGVEGTTGHQLFRSQTPGPASLHVTFASDGVVVAERLGCHRADRPNPERGTVMVRYDARTRRERWHQRAGIVTVGLEDSGWATAHSRSASRP
jgi:hypothetical protein